jgi:Translation initiation factor IF-2, N-terminal region
MGKIRIYELARELEVRSDVIIDYLAELGIGERRAATSAVDDELADKARKHFPTEGQKKGGGASPKSGAK